MDANKYEREKTMLNDNDIKISDFTGSDLLSVSNISKLTLIGKLKDVITGSGIDYFAEDTGYMSIEDVKGSRVLFTSSYFDFTLDLKSNYTKLVATINIESPYGAVDMINKTGERIELIGKTIADICNKLIALKPKFEKVYGDFTKLTFDEFTFKNYTGDEK